MNTSMFATVAKTIKGRSLALFYCTAPRSTGNGGMGMTQLDCITVGLSAKALAAKAQEMSLTLVNAPTAASRYYLRGEKQANGNIVTPIIDWEGNVVDQQVATPYVA